MDMALFLTDTNFNAFLFNDHPINYLGKGTKRREGYETALLQL